MNNVLGVNECFYTTAANVSAINNGVCDVMEQVCIDDNNFISYVRSFPSLRIIGLMTDNEDKLRIMISAVLDIARQLDMMNLRYVCEDKPAFIHMLKVHGFIEKSPESYATTQYHVLNYRVTEE